tara:strand:+ start:36 stop:515 length:480 start_codon:yes stop_codon:yes gene_type:complete
MEPDVSKVLFESGDLSSSTRMMVHEYANKWNVSEYDALLQCHIFSEAELADLIASSTGYDRIYAFSSNMVDEGLIKNFPFKDAWDSGCMPLRKDNQEVHSYVMVDPFSLLNSRFSENLGPVFEKFIVEKSIFYRAILSLYPLEMQLADLNVERASNGSR